MSLSPASSVSAGGGGGLFDAYAYLRDEQASGTDGGASASATWNTRVLNTEVFDTGAIVSLAANRFTLAAGTYLIVARAPTLSPANTSNAHKLRLRNITAGSDALVGASQFSFNASTDGTLAGRVTVAGATVFELQHYTESGRAGVGLGIHTGTGLAEVYAEVWIYREP